MICHVYVGSYMGQGGGDGIYLFRLDTERESLERISSYPELSSQPSFLAVIWFSVSGTGRRELSGESWRRLRSRRRPL